MGQLEFMGVSVRPASCAPTETTAQHPSARRIHAEMRAERFRRYEVLLGLQCSCFAHKQRFGTHFALLFRDQCLSTVQTEKESASSDRTKVPATPAPQRCNSKRETKSAPFSLSGPFAWQVGASRASRSSTRRTARWTCTATAAFRSAGRAAARPQTSTPSSSDRCASAVCAVGEVRGPNNVRFSTNKHRQGNTLETCHCVEPQA